MASFREFSRWKVVGGKRARASITNIFRLKSQETFRASRCVVSSMPCSVLVSNNTPLLVGMHFSQALCIPLVTLRRWSAFLFDVCSSN